MSWIISFARGGFSWHCGALPYRRAEPPGGAPVFPFGWFFRIMTILLPDRQVPPSGGCPPFAFICSAVTDSITNSAHYGHHASSAFCPWQCRLLGNAARRRLTPLLAAQAFSSLLPVGSSFVVGYALALLGPVPSPCSGLRLALLAAYARFARDHSPAAPFLNTILPLYYI